MRFRFETSDNLSYNKKINVKVCLISLSSVFKERDGIIHRLNYKNNFYEIMKIDCFFIKTAFLIKNKIL